MEQINRQKTKVSAAIRIAIELAGGQVALAKAINRSQASVSDWSRGVSVPAEAAIKIELATGIPAEQISPPLATYATLRGLSIRDAA